MVLDFCKFGCGGNLECSTVDTATKTSGCRGEKLAEWLQGHNGDKGFVSEPTRVI